MHIIAIDQGTTSTRAILFDNGARAVASAQMELPQHYPAPGQVEHDPEEIWRDTVTAVRQVLKQSGLGTRDIGAIGITNQRETTLVWDRESGRPIHNAIVWQDRRGEAMCRALREAGHEDMIRDRTGLLLDPYFSATKIAWLLETVEGARTMAREGRLAFGTIDSFLLWRLTGGRVHAVDATNASRTMLYDIRRGEWCSDLCALFGVPMDVLPEVRDSAGIFGETDPNLFGGAITIAGVAGDQQAALIGQGCFGRGEAKATYGTGCFMLLNTGDDAVASRHRLLTTVAYRLNGRSTYALEGAIFVAGAAVKWLRDGLGLVTEAAQTQEMAGAVEDNGGVYLVPAFAGLGAPHWRPDARALLSGMTLGTGAAHLARAALESVAYQTHDLIEAMRSDGAGVEVLRVDGGMSANDWLCGFLASLLDCRIIRPAMLETTARGAALLAGHGIGLWPDMASADALREDTTQFGPAMAPGVRRRLIGEWHEALARALHDPAGLELSASRA